MIRLLGVLLISVILFSCGSSDKEIQQKYILSLEEKNAALENELKSCRDGRVQSGSDRSALTNGRGYFTIGSTEEEVLNVMGDPDNLTDLGSFGKTFSYDGSTVLFEKGKVKSYRNRNGNLKVRVK